MSEPTRKRSAGRPEDEFYDYVNAALDDPDYVAALEDANELHRIIDSLVAARQRQQVTQKELARRMGVSQPTVSGFETEMADPRIGTVQRYARAVGCRVVMSVQRRISRDGLPAAYVPMDEPRAGSAGAVGTAENRVPAWERRNEYSRSDYGTAA